MEGWTHEYYDSKKIICKLGDDYEGQMVLTSSCCAILLDVSVKPYLAVPVDIRTRVTARTMDIINIALYNHISQINDLCQSKSFKRRFH